MSAKDRFLEGLLAANTQAQRDGLSEAQRIIVMQQYCLTVLDGLRYAKALPPATLEEHCDVARGAFVMLRASMPTPQGPKGGVQA